MQGDLAIFFVLGVTVLLSLTVFQDSVSETMPITSLQIPLLGNHGYKVLPTDVKNNHLLRVSI